MAILISRKDFDRGFEKCSKCGGYRLAADGSTACAKCNGTGQQARIAVRVPQTTGL